MGSEIWPMKYKVWHPWNAAQVFPQTFLLEVVCAEDPLLFFYSVFLPPSSLPSHHRYQTQIVVQSLLPSCGLISSPFTEDSPNKVLAFLILSFIVCVLALHCCMWAFFSCSKRGGGPLSSCGAESSHCSGFSCCRAWALKRRLSSCGCLSLVAPWHVGSFQIRDEPMFPALQGGFLTTGPTGKPSPILFESLSLSIN